MLPANILFHIGHGALRQKDYIRFSLNLRRFLKQQPAEAVLIKAERAVNQTRSFILRQQEKTA